MPRRISFAFFGLILPLLLTLTACTFESKSSAQGVAPAPSTQQEKIAPIPTAMDTFRALAPPEGMRFTPLFNAPVSGDEARIKRLEDAVQTIRNDIDTLVPTMVRMVAIEKDIKGLVAQLQTLTGENAPPVQAQPVVDVAPAQALPEPVKEQQAPVKKIPGEDAAKGTEPAKALPAAAGPDASSPLVTPETAPEGELPPEGAVSPNLRTLSPDEKKLIIPPEIPQQLPPPAKRGALKIPGEDVARGTEPGRALPPLAGPAAMSSLVTPEAALEGELPPESAASPSSRRALKPLDIKTPRAAAPSRAAVTDGDVINLRISDQATHTRMVLDMTAGPTTPMKMTDGGKTLVIDLSKLGWGGQTVWQSDKTKLIVGGRIEEGNLYVDLTQPATIEKRMLLPPDGNSRNWRLLIDLKRR